MAKSRREKPLLYEEFQEDEDEYEYDEEVTPVEVPLALAEETSKVEGAQETPYLRAGAEPVSDAERLRLRPYKQNMDRILAALAARQYDNSAANNILSNEGVIRWLEVGLPPEALKGMEEKHRRYRYERRDAGTPRTVYRPPGFKAGANYTEPVQDPEPEEENIDEEEQHWWVLDIFKPERTTREFTGFCMKPTSWVDRRTLWLLHGRGLWGPLADPNVDLSSPDQKQLVLDIRAAFADADMDVTEHFFDYREVVRVYEEEFVPLAEAAVAAGTVEKVEHYAKYFYTPFFTSQLIAFWVEFEKRYRFRVEGRNAPRSQTEPEAIQAKESAADLFSCVLEPLLTEWDERLRILWGTQDTRYENGDGIHFLRKIVDLIKDWYAKRRRKANQIFNAGDAVGSGDSWFAGLWDPFEFGYLKIPLDGVPEEIKQRIYQVIYGWLPELGDEFLLPSGAEAGVWHQNLLAWIISSFNALVEMGDHAQTASIKYKDLDERWLPKLAQFDPEETELGWWDRKEKRLYAVYDPAHPNRELRIGLRHDFLTWLDWRWVMMRDGDQAYFWQIPTFMNRRFVKNQIERVKIDDHREATPNFLRHHDIAREIWRYQAEREVIRKLMRVWNREVTKGTIHIRPVYYREVLSELSQELLADLPTPDKERVQQIRDETAKQLAAATTKEEKRKLQDNLDLLNRCLRRDAKDLDTFTKFVQKLNQDSDARVRMWAGFLSHAKDGGIMAFEPGEATGYVKENYGADTGGPYEDLQATPVDLVVFAWINPQFNKAVYLARGLSYTIKTAVEPLERHRLVGGAISGGLHPKIANLVVQGFGGLERYLVPLDESEATKYVQRVFERKEIEQLGRRVVKQLLEKELLRKEMRLQIIT